MAIEVEVKTYYRVVCDECPERFDAFSSSNEAEQEAWAAGWSAKGLGDQHQTIHHLCPACAAVLGK